jgi:hypothetical protein
MFELVPKFKTFNSLQHRSMAMIVWRWSKEPNKADLTVYWEYLMHFLTKSGEIFLYFWRFLERSRVVHSCGWDVRNSVHCFETRRHDLKYQLRTLRLTLHWGWTYTRSVNSSSFKMRWASSRGKTENGSMAFGGHIFLKRLSCRDLRYCINQFCGTIPNQEDGPWSLDLMKTLFWRLFHKSPLAWMCRMVCPHFQAYVQLEDIPT